MGVTRLQLATMLAVAIWVRTDRPFACGSEVDYLRDVKPILREHCYACHGAVKQQGSLRLDTGDAIRRGGDSGPAAVPGDASASWLLRVVTGEAGFRMPPEGEGKPLSAEEVDILRAWILAGAASPEGEEPQQDPRAHWSYQPVRRPAIPAVRRQDWVRTPIDAFIAERHEALQLEPVADAPPAVWLRRVYLDLIGLPPTPDELHAFLADPSERARERIVDDLLNRPQYGERWGRHWMDVWRYSDWYGSRKINEIRYSQRHIWRWRDWIVESLNADHGYDRMLVEMLAGDELAAGNPDVLRATGFLGRNWYKFDRNVWMFETVEQTAQAFLGVTMRCCRCHDHKYEPITQQEYYRFRAFFEPHDVRTDPLSISAGTEKDATLGEVLKVGVARVYDKHLDAPTYVFQRGDDRYPDKDHPLTPGVPAALGGPEVTIEPVALHPLEFYPALRPTLADQLLMEAEARVQRARAAVDTANEEADAAHRVVEELEQQQAVGGVEDAPEKSFLHDEFDTERPDVWQVVSGQWQYKDGFLTESSVGSFATIVTKQNHPRDFRVRVVYRTLAPGTYRSVGFSFDYVDQGNSQDVYTSTGDASQSVQAFHRTGGKQVYPPAGIVKTLLQVDQPVTLECEVRGTQLVLWLNGEQKLVYALPIERRDGKFALWVHAGSASFDSLEITALRPTLAGARQAWQAKQDAATAAELSLRTAEAQRESVRRRLEAERAKYLRDDLDAAAKKALALAASRAERRVAVCQAEEAVLAARRRRAAAAALAPSESVEPPAAVQEADKQLAEATAKLEQARKAFDAPDGTYAPVGDVYPSTSSGRRLALARWMTARDNPRTARVGVNQIWMRHFGEPLVPSVANFGLGGQDPVNGPLLDWLAAEWMDHGWRMKHLHRLIVLSRVYRLDSAARSSSPDSPIARNAAIDPANRYLWHAPSRRMEAELVRDAILSVSGQLDLRLGGPEIPESMGHSVLRRSMYFRNTPNERMLMLELFDVANPNECYRRRESVVPQQALAMMNSGMALDQARRVAAQLAAECGDAPDLFVVAAFERVLNRPPTAAEQAACRRFLSEHVAILRADGNTPFAPGGESTLAPSADPAQRARENLVHVLFNHNDFVTIR